MPAGYPRERETDVVLRDGSTAHLRPILESDEQDLLRFLEALSERSRSFRFFSAAASLEWAARSAIDVDHADRFGLVVLDGDPAAIVGHGTYIRETEERAEVAFAVADSRQGLGLATILLAHLADAARAHGITTFSATVLAQNHQMLQVFRDSGFPLAVRSGPGELTVELPTSLTPAARSGFEQRDRLAAAAAVSHVLEPASVVLVGASDRPGSIGAALTRNLLSGGFAGELHLVNRRGGELDGRPRHRSVLDVPGPVELAVIAVPAAGAVEVARECARKGVRSLVVVAAGFAETGPDGARRQRELLAVCRAAGMRLVGPNCLGVLNTAVGLDATFAPGDPPAGGVGVMSQSGGVGIAVIEQARELGLGLSSFASVGNKADVSGNDFLQFWEQDEHTGVILLYLESFGNPRRFARIAPRVAAVKPILAVKSARSAAGAKAAGSHTGALLASADVTVDALFRQAGVIRADTLGELFDVAALLSGQPLPKGPSVAILTNAGGPGILAADACAGHGLEVPPPAAATQESLRAFAAPEATVGNPVDLIAGASAEHYARAVGALAGDPAVDAIVAVFVPTLVTTADDVAAAVAKAAGDAARSVPILGVFMTAGEPPAALRDAGIPVYGFPEDAIRALGHAAAYAAWRDAPRGDTPAPADVRPDEAAAVIAEALKAGAGWLDPPRVASLCRCYGVPLADWRAARSAEEAARMARDLGGHVALKAVAPGLVHKTGAGGVRLGLRGVTAVRRAARRMRDDVARAGYGRPTYVVQRMVPGGVEMLVGVVHDPQFGPVLACGAGGTAVELLNDVAVRLTPLTGRDAREAIRALATFPLLDGYRGAPKADVAALEDLLLRVGAMVDAHAEIAELEANPVIVRPDGVTAIDVRVRVAPATVRAPSPSLGA